MSLVAITEVRTCSIKQLAHTIGLRQAIRCCSALLQRKHGQLPPVRDAAAADECVHDLAAGCDHSAITFSAID